MSASDYLETAVLGHVYGSTTMAKPSKFLALFTAAPTDAAGSGTEVPATGTGYARQNTAFTVSGSSPTQAANSAQFDYPVATASWGTISHWATFDAATGGNMLNHGALNASKAIAVGDTFRVAAASIVITLD